MSEKIRWQRWKKRRSRAEEKTPDAGDERISNVMKITGIEDVIGGRLCVGCGACAYVSGGALEMREKTDEGWRPVLMGGEGAVIPADCAAACPVIGTTAPESGIGNCREAQGLGLGQVLASWEVHASDQATRYQGSSGGALSALAAYALERQGMQGVLHIGRDPLNPFRNQPMLSVNREELLDRAGSRYAPACLCSGLRLIENAQGPCVVIGQPSEIAALRKVVAIRPSLADKIGLSLSFFCAGSPAIRGTMDLIRSRGIDPHDVTDIRYRGHGWPGNFSVHVKDREGPVIEMTYAESWAFLQKYRTWGVHLWPDGAGEHADISCGDPWYRKVAPSDPGSSLVLARTERGRAFVEEAIRDGVLVGGLIDTKKVVLSQKNLLAKKGSIGGRLFAMRMLRLPVPNYQGYRLGRLWWNLPVGEKLRSVVGTIRRVLERGYDRPGTWTSVTEPTHGTDGKPGDPRAAGETA